MKTLIITPLIASLIVGGGCWSRNNIEASPNPLSKNFGLSLRVENDNTTFRALDTQSALEVILHTPLSEGVVELIVDQPTPSHRKVFGMVTKTFS